MDESPEIGPRRKVRAPKRLWWAVLLVIPVAATLVAGNLYRRHKRFGHFAVHDEGLVFRSGWMHPAALSDVIDRHQIRTVVNLCGRDEMTPADWLGTMPLFGRKEHNVHVRFFGQTLERQRIGRRPAKNPAARSPFRCLHQKD